jgi:hypothetical protein
MVFRAAGIRPVEPVAIFPAMSDLHFSHPGRRRAHRIPQSRRRGIYVTFAVLLLTGFIWLAIHFMAEDSLELTALLAWSMKLHGAAAWLATYLIGTIWVAHIKLAWKLQHNRWAGAAFGLTVTLLLISGYGLYYFNGETVRMLTEWLHWSAGALAACLFWVHLRLGKRYAKLSIDHSSGRAHAPRISPPQSAQAQED